MSCPRTQHNVPSQGSNPDRSIRRRAHYPLGFIHHSQHTKTLATLIKMSRKVLKSSNLAYIMLLTSTWENVAKIWLSLWVISGTMYSCHLFPTQQMNYRMNYCSLPKFIPDGWSISSINPANNESCWKFSTGFLVLFPPGRLQIVTSFGRSGD